MDIIRKSCTQGALEAEGLTVIIDVFRAFSCVPLFFHLGASRVILEADTETALSLKMEDPRFVLVGEANEVPIKGADLGNSPSHIILKGESYFRGTTVIHRTTAGVAGVKAAFDRAEEILLGSYVLAKATAEYVRSRDPGRVCLVAMGERGKRPAPEDEYCADYLEYLLDGGRDYDPVEAFREVVFHSTARKFLKGTKGYLPREDPLFCLQTDLFDFALAVRKVEERLEVFRIAPAPVPGGEIPGPGRWKGAR